MCGKYGHLHLSLSVWLVLLVHYRRMEVTRRLVQYLYKHAHDAESPVTVLLDDGLAESFEATSPLGSAWPGKSRGIEGITLMSLATDARTQDMLLLSGTEVSRFISASPSSSTSLTPLYHLSTSAWW